MTIGEANKRPAREAGQTSMEKGRASMAMKILTRITFGVTAMTLLAINVPAGAINPSDVVVVQVGDGSTALTANTAPVSASPTGSSGPATVLTIPAGETLRTAKFPFPAALESIT